MQINVEKALDEGATLGKYRLIRKLGRGASGVVYLAGDTVLGREVALKILHPELGRDEAFVRRFQREARLIARLSHPGIVVIHALDRIDGQLMIDAQYHAHGALHDFVSRVALSTHFIARIGAQVAQALAACHQESVVHRDVKPSNILIAEDGSARLCDFGLAAAYGDRLSESMQTQHSSGVFLGTPLYAPPEAWDGVEASAAGDTYALGMVLYELFAKGHPYTATTPMALVKEMSRQPLVHLEERVATLPPAIAHVVMDLLAEEPDQRPRDLVAVAETLNEYACTGETGQETLARPLGVQPDLSRYTRQRAKIRLSFLCLSVLLTLAVGVMLGLALERSLGRNSAMMEQTAPLIWEVSSLDDSRFDTLWRSQSDSDSFVMTGPGSVLWFSREEPGLDSVMGFWAYHDGPGGILYRDGTVSGRFVERGAGTAEAALQFACRQDNAVTRELYNVYPVAVTPNIPTLSVALGCEAGTARLLADHVFPRRDDFARAIQSVLLESSEYTVLANHDVVSRSWSGRRTLGNDKSITVNSQGEGTEIDIMLPKIANQVSSTVEIRLRRLQEPNTLYRVSIREDRILESKLEISNNIAPWDGVGLIPVDHQSAHLKIALRGDVWRPEAGAAWQISVAQLKADSVEPQSTEWPDSSQGDNCGDAWVLFE